MKSLVNRITQDLPEPNRRVVFRESEEEDEETIQRIVEEISTELKVKIKKLNKRNCRGAYQRKSSKTIY